MPAYLLCDDLIFSSKITATARAHGLALVVVKTPTRLIELLTSAPGPVIADLHLAGPEITQLVQQSPSVVGYGSHVAIDQLKAARQAGCKVVLPNSAFVEKLETDLPTWLGTQPGAGSD
jgi:hypothetical protein